MRTMNLPAFFSRALTAAALAGALFATPVAGQKVSNGGDPSDAEQQRGENGSGSGKPIDITFNYAGDLNADVSGGNSRGLVFLGRASVLFDSDLDKLLGLHGATAHLSFYDIHGNGLSDRHVGNLLLVSGLEAGPAIRLNQAWVEIAPLKATSVRVGKFTAGQEFMTSRTANLFVNSTFGWPDSFATDLPSGGPSYPLAAPGVRLAVKPDDRTIVRAAVFAGDPAGPGGGDPQRRDLHGFNTFGFAGNPFVIAEVSRSSGGQTPALVGKIGGWIHLDRFADVGDPAAVPGPTTGRGGHGVDVSGYGVIDARLWKSAADEKRTARVFARLSYSPTDRNVVDLYADAGISLSAPFSGRDGDTVGLGFGIARVSPQLRSAARLLLSAGTPATIPPAFEGVAELTYQAALLGPIKVQPNLQYIIHPAESALSIQTPGGRVPSALVLGLRLSASL